MKHTYRGLTLPELNRLLRPHDWVAYDDADKTLIPTQPRTALVTLSQGKVDYARSAHAHLELPSLHG